MAIPGQSITINDPGVGNVAPVPSTPLYLGTSSAGTANTLTSVQNIQALKDTFGEGPLVEAGAYALANAGGPILVMRMTTDVAATESAVTKTAVGSSTGTITLSGAALDEYDARIEITASGTVGAGRFRYSLDKGNDTDAGESGYRTFTEEIVIPAGGTYTATSTGVVFTFVPGAGAVFFEDGDTHDWTSTAPYYTTTSLGTAITALLLTTTAFAFIVLTGRPASTSDGATMFAALETHLTSLETQFRYTRAFMDAGDDTVANASTDFAAVEDNRISVCYARAATTTAKPFPGWGAPNQSLVVAAGGRAAASLISTDLARVASGALTGVLDLEHDEFLVELLDQERLTTARTWIGRAGFYLTNARIKSAAGSDFRYWQHGRIMDVACTTIFNQQQTFISAGIRTNDDGTIDERDAVRLETRVETALRIQLTQPDNAEGTRGHVSALSYTIDRANNVLVSETINSDTAIRALAYPKTINAQIGFAQEV